MTNFLLIIVLYAFTSIPGTRAGSPKNSNYRLNSSDHIAYFVDQEKWKHSCSGEGGELDNSTANKLSQTRFSKHYFFFSLSMFSKDNSAIEYRFHKNNNFKEIPEYILSNLGLYHKGKKLCEWYKPYSEGRLFFNYLPECFGNKHQFLSFYNTGSPQGGIDLCSVVNVYDFEIDQNGKYLIKVKIGEELFYLDISDMPDLANGSKLWTLEKRKSVFEKNAKIKHQKTLDALNILKMSNAFKKMHKCTLNKDKSCLKTYYSEIFLSNIQESGLINACMSSDPKEKERTKCIPYYRKLSDTADKYLYEFVEQVLSNKTDLLEFYKSEIPSGKPSIEYRSTNPHNPDKGALMWIELDENSIIFSSFSDMKSH